MIAETADPARPPRKRGWLIAGIIGIALIVLVIVHLISGKKAKPPPSVQVVSVAHAILGEMPETLNELGTVTPIATVNVLPQLSGYLTAVGYHEGEDVAKGQFLAQIDPRQFQISKQQAEAQLARDQASLAQARSDLVRFTQLNQQKSIAEQTFVDQKFLVQQDEAAVEADRASIAQFDLDLIYCHITAPVAGRVGLRLVDPGNFVTQSSSPGIVTITTMKPTTVEFTVPQNSLSKVLERFNSGAKLAYRHAACDVSQRRRAIVPERVRQREVAGRYTAKCGAGADAGGAERCARRICVSRQCGPKRLRA
jgi:multidrug efflux system membrane fusion protein